MTGNPKETDLSRGFSITRVLDAPRPLVWQAWTDPEELAHWFHPRGMTSPREDIHVDLRVGGRYGYVMVADGTGERVPTGGVYLEIEEPERLVFTWAAPEDPVEDSPVITVVLAEIGGKTELTFRLQGIAGHPGDGFVYDGWIEALDQLTGALAGHGG
ncbi:MULTISPECIES: SRPBCC domain-containing protein [Streptomyces]|uniref:Activator of HSP90 ATPase-like n=1 Tax=Streptomyces albus (strain ATCC 21838 / DSM 41398 / FERM P-419 / JCM 4703 / NBRC 107858) TaxID=1081613 RepID=A0A0B5ELF9_STRA4|nr:SRPBCC domain-containing protein [Streptomyces sp. SCSIO ZS0520]AJE82339.1 activator of HSP90 ATPase-like [Streptomyces albus]AOU76655.1 activator of HSP90 ATPase-like [Streptomyces albus]AYN32436.1 SRPBCC domain-containing protein [Streptomyces albus]